ncbi:hypothetical protein [Lewinella sp. IMCC34183]|uniref:hypothetical protein n=1 Tax=Lewinella sp. IMCC34183 TaxID=2248762 RepID=UPI000E284E06|nr:hypothetical protein [Lewinella sp. IMCC34183]
MNVARFLALCALLVTLSVAASGQSTAWSTFLIGSVMENNGEEQAFGTDRVQFYQPNSAIAAEVNYRRYGFGKWSFETGVRLSSRNFKTIRFGAPTPSASGGVERRGRIQGGYLTSLAVPVRVFYGTHRAHRTDANRSSGFYAGGMLRINANYGRGDLSGLQYAIYRAVHPRLSPSLLAGARTRGRLLNLQLEVELPLMAGQHTVAVDNTDYRFRFREFRFSVGVGHTF